MKSDIAVPTALNWLIFSTRSGFFKAACAIEYGTSLVPERRLPVFVIKPALCCLASAIAVLIALATASSFHTYPISFASVRMSDAKCSPEPASIARSISSAAATRVMFELAFIARSRISICSSEKTPLSFQLLAIPSNPSCSSSI